MTIHIVSAAKIRPSTYNPRKADERRLQFVELSLQGVQRPLSVGFPPTGHEVFRFGEFVGWVVESG